ncbi:hypothetical protein AB0892_32065 [Streptomyces sp. NPDC005409]
MRQISVDTTAPVPDASMWASSDLLDRALVGWEHFLDTFETVSDE